MCSSQLSAFGKMVHTNILIGIPCYGGQVFNECVVGLLQFRKACDEHNREHERDTIDFEVEFLANESLVTRARNTIVAKFLSQPAYTHLLFIDADIGFCGPDLMLLVQADKEVIGGVYPKKSIDFQLIKTFMDLLPKQDLELYEVISKNYAIEVDMDHANRLLSSSNPIVQVKYLPTGFLLIARSVFTRLQKAFPSQQYDGFCESRNEELKDHYWLFFDTMLSKTEAGTQRYLSEDWAFCEKVKKVGIKLFAHIGFGLNHMGFYKFRGHPGAIRLQHNVRQQLAEEMEKRKKSDTSVSATIQA